MTTIIITVAIAIVAVFTDVVIFVLPFLPFTRYSTLHVTKHRKRDNSAADPIRNQKIGLLHGKSSNHKQSIK